MDDSDDEIRTVSAVCSDNEGEVVIIAEQEEEQLETMTNEIIENPCWGCREQQPNQLAHMSPGGCLYAEDDELVEVQEFQGAPTVTEVTEAMSDSISDAESV